MPQIIFNTNDQSPSSEMAETIITLLKNITAKAVDAKPNGSQTKIKVAIEIPYTPEFQQKILDQGQLKCELENLKTALQKPHELEGRVIILADDERVLHVEDGEIIRDSFNILTQVVLDNRIKECFDIAKREIEGKDLLESVTAMMEIYGNYSPLNDLLHFESRNYIFNYKDEQLKVTAKDGDREILNNSGFTEVATNKDMAALQKFKDIVEEIMPDDNSQTERPSLKL